MRRVEHDVFRETLLPALNKIMLRSPEISCYGVLHLTHFISLCTFYFIFSVINIFVSLFRTIFVTNFAAFVSALSQLHIDLSAYSADITKSILRASQSYVQLSNAALLILFSRLCGYKYCTRRFGRCSVQPTCMWSRRSSARAPCQRCAHCSPSAATWRPCKARRPR